MATQFLSRTFPKTLTLASFFTRSLSTTASVSVTSRSSFSTFSFIHRLRPVASVAIEFRRLFPSASTRNFATRATSSSLNDPNPNWSNRPPKETILLDGCDFEHWLVVMEKPEGDPTRDEIIDSYIKTLAQVVGSEEESRMKIYSVSTRHYYAFGALVSEELSYKIKELPRVRWVLPDSYLDVKNKDYGGEPFINGQAVPYDPKYHEEWVRNNARANERNRRNDRPRNADRSRNFERRRENVINRDMPRMANQANTGGYPPNNMGGAPPSNAGGYPPNMGGAPPSNAGGYPPNMGGAPPSNAGGYPPNMGGAPPSNVGGYPPNMGGGPPSNVGAPPNNPGGYASNNMSGAAPNNPGGYTPNNMSGAAPNNPGGYTPNNMSGAPPSNPGGYPPNMGRAPPSHMGGVPTNNMGHVPPSNMGGGTYGNMQSNSPMGGVPPNNYPGMTPNNMGGMPPPNQNMGGAGWSNNVPGRDNQPNYNPNRDMGGPSGGNPYQG